MKKILFVINTLGQGGAEKALLEVLRRIPYQEYEVSLYVLTGQGELIRELPKEVVLRNASYCELPVLSKAGRKKLLQTSIKAIFHHGNFIRRFPYLVRNLYAMIRKGQLQIDKLLWRFLADAGEELEEEYDLAVAFLEGGAAYYVAEKVKASRKAVFIHIDYPSSGYTRELDRNCYYHFHRIFAISQNVKESFLTMYPDLKSCVAIFPNLMDSNKILSKAKEPGGFSDSYKGIRILTVGRLVEQKAYDVAIEAMWLLRKDGYDVKWYVLGEGTLRKNLERLIAEKGLQDDFLLLGNRENPYPYFAQTDIYVHATKFEGKSIAVQEAKLLGCPVIVSDSPGNREQITPGVDGLLCDLKPESVKEQIIAFIKNPNLRRKLAQNASEQEQGTGDISGLLLLADTRNNTDRGRDKA